MRKIIRGLAAGLLAFLFVANTVTAYTYHANLTIQESGGVTYTQVPLFYSWTAANLTGNGFMDADGLDHLVSTSAEVALPSLVASDRLLFVTDLAGNTTLNDKFSLGNYATMTNGTGIATGSPITFDYGANTPTITQAGTFTVWLPGNSTGTATTGGWTVTGSPKALAAGSNTVTVEAGGAGTITVTINKTMPIITGYGGYVTTAYAAALEPGGNFDIDFSGYINTAAGANKDIYFKDGALRLYVSGAGDVTGLLTDTDTIVPFSSTSDGYIQADNAVYDTARNALTGTVWDAIENISVGQGWGGATFGIQRAFLFFDTSAIPDGATITAATIYLYGAADDSADNFDVTVCNGQPTYPTDPLAAGDYRKEHYTGDVTTNGGELTTAGWAVGSYNALTMSATGIGWINKTGTTKLTLRSSEDLLGNTPGANIDIVSFKSSNTAGTASDPYLSVTYTDTRTVTASGVASGEHTILLYADGTDMAIEVDSVEEDTIALAGAAATDNANNIIWLRNNVSPYADSLEYSVGGTLIAWYQPITIISGTTMPDREGAAQNGTITWGTNPADIDITVSGLVSTSQPLPALPPSGGTSTDILQPYEQPGWSSQSEAALQSNPFYPIVDALATFSTFSDMQVWVFFASGFVILAMIIVFKFMPHILAMLVAGGIASGFFVAIGIYPFWVIFIFIVGILAIAIKEMNPGV